MSKVREFVSDMSVNKFIVQNAKTEARRKTSSF